MSPSVLFFNCFCPSNSALAVSLTHTPQDEGLGEGQLLFPYSCVLFIDHLSSYPNGSGKRSPGLLAMPLTLLVSKRTDKSCFYCRFAAPTVADLPSCDDKVPLHTAVVIHLLGGTWLASEQNITLTHSRCYPAAWGQSKYSGKA